MDLTQFRATVAQEAPPDGISLALQTLWWDAKGDWDRAHNCAQADEGKTGEKADVPGVPEDPKAPTVVVE